MMKKNIFLAAESNIKCSSQASELANGVMLDYGRGWRMG